MPSREQREQFEQDRLGNVRRRLDEIRGQTGNHAETDSNSDPQGLENIAGGETGSDQILMRIPDTARAFHLTRIHAHNSGSSEDTFVIKEATLTSGGAVDTSTDRTVPINVAASKTRFIDYGGEEFDQNNVDAIVVNSNFAGDIGIEGYMDRPEEEEPNTEITGTPSS